MGNEINTNYIQEKVRLADMMNGNQDGKIDNNEKSAIVLFETSVKEDYKNKVIDKSTFKEAMGLFTTKKAENVTRPEKKETRAEQKEQKQTEKTNNEYRNATLTELTKVVSQGATLDNVQEKLSKNLTNPAYKEAITEVGVLLEQINMIGFNSKKDVDNLKKAVKDKMYLDGVGKDIVDKLIELAEKEQIERETEYVMNLYNDIKNSYYEEHGYHDFSCYKGALEYGLKEEGKMGTSYFDKALSTVVNMIKKDSDSVNDSNRVYTTGEKAKTVRKELNEHVQQDDKISRKAIKNDKADNELDARYNKFHNNAEELKSISEKDLKNKLGKDLFNELNKKYLHTAKNADGTYNLTALVEIFQTRMGHNYLINRSADTEMSEYEHIKDDIRILTGQYDLSNKDFEKIRELCAAEMEKKDHSLAGALGSDLLEDGLIGATAAFLTGQKIVMTQEMGVTVPVDVANNIMKQAKELGYDLSSTTLADGRISLVLGQKLLKDTRLLEALAGAGIGVLQGILLQMIIGQERDEKSCFSVNDFDYSNPKYTNFEQYEEYITSKYPGGKGEAIVALAKTFVDENGKFDRTAFDSMVNNIAGVGSRITCDEVAGNRIVQAKQEKPEVQAEMHSVAIKDIEGTEAEFANIPTIDGTRTTWQKVTEMYGDCLSGIEIDKNKYPNCARRRGELAIRLVKVAQAVTDGNYSYERLMDLAEKTFAAKTSKYTELQGYEGINHEILVNTMKATELGKDVRVPNELAGCKKINNDVQKEIVTNQTKDVVKAQERGNTQYKVKEGTADKYHARFDGEEKVYNSDTERGLAIEDYYKKHNDNIEWQKW